MVAALVIYVMLIHYLFLEKSLANRDIGSGHASDGRVAASCTRVRLFKPLNKQNIVYPICKLNRKDENQGKLAWN